MDPSTLRWQEEDTCYYCNNGIVDTCEVVRLVHGTREYELHIDESTRSDREGRDIFVPVESDRLHFQHPEADRSMPSSTRRVQYTYTYIPTSSV